MKKIVGICVIAALFVLIGCEKNAAPTCNISTPSEGEIIVKGSVYTIKADADDPDDNMASLRFYIDNDGVSPFGEIVYSYDWDTDEALVGNHTVTVIALDDEGEQASSSRQIEIVDIDPDGDFVANKLSVMVYDTIEFTDLTLNYPIKWLWDFGDEDDSKKQNPNKIYTKSGIYSVSLTVTNSSGENTSTKTDYITVSKTGQAPIAGFSANHTNIQQGSTVNFTDLSANNPTAWLWDFGDGSTSDGKNPSYTYNTNGTYTVKLTATNNNGSSSEEKTDYITVFVGDTLPTANFMADQTTVSAGDTINFTDLSTNTPTNWNWDFGDGGSSTSQSPYYIYTVPGTYSVSLSISNEVGSDTKTITDYITITNLAPVADFMADTTVVFVGSSLGFTDLSINNPETWLWDFGDATTSTAQNPNHSFNSTGTFTISLTSGNGSGSDVKIKTDYILVVNDSIDADFSADQTAIEEGTTVNFTDLSTNYPDNWNWDFGDGGSSTGQNPSYTFSTAGTFTVILTSSNSTGSNTETKTDYIVVSVPGSAPIVDFMADETTINIGSEISFTDLSVNSPNSWLWNFGDGIASTDANPTHTYIIPGIYSVSLTVANNYGSDTKTITDYITVTGIPEADFSANETTVTVGESVVFTDLSLNYPSNWSWDFGDGGASSGQNPIYTFTAPGTYTISLITTNNYGSDTEIKTDYITVNAK